MSTSSLSPRPQRISVNASLPFYSKLNIRIHTRRMLNDESLSPKHIQATATVRRFNADEENDYENYQQQIGRDSFWSQSLTDFPEKLPRQRQISLPVSLPIDQRLYLYIRNGEVLARC